MKIVITGALGHIGSFVIRDFVNYFPKSEIIMIDNLMTQRFPSLFNLPTLMNYQFINADVSLMDLNQVFIGVDVVIHLAAITDAAGSFDKAEEIEANNYLSTLRVADACAHTGAALIAVSSTSVYGTQNDIVDENCSNNELKPQSPYAEIKLKEEQYINKLVINNSLNAIHCRFGTIFGVSTGIRFHTAVNKFCWQAAMGQPITVWTSAFDQKRPYLDLKDASAAMAFIIKNKLFDGRIYNVLTHNLTVRSVVETIKEFVPSLSVNFVDNQIMNQLSYEVLCERFTSEGFEFSGDIRKGIKDTLFLLKGSNNPK
jgi:UDP-glucose 4-epimerase